MSKRKAKKEVVRNTTIVSVSLKNELVQQLDNASETRMLNRSALITLALTEMFARTAPPIVSKKIT